MASEVKVAGKKAKWAAYDEEQVKKAARVAEAGGIVGLPDSGPWAELSLSSLWHDLDNGRRRFLIGQRLRQGKQRGSHKKLEEIEITAKRLGKLLCDDVFRFVTRLPAINDDGDLRPFVDARRAREVLQIIADLAGEMRAWSGIDQPWNAFELLVGRQLAGVYEKFSGNSVKLKRRVIEGYSQELKGKFLSFALQALEELQINKSDGEPYSLESIGRAYTRVKSGKPRDNRRRTKR
jgi:hypothetical protein